MGAVLDWLSRGGTRFGLIGGASALRKTSWKSILAFTGAGIGGGGITGITWASPELAWRVGLACKVQEPIRVKPGESDPLPGGVYVTGGKENVLWGIHGVVPGDGGEREWGDGAKCYRINIGDYL